MSILEEGGIVTGLGLLVVFTCLILIIFVIMFLSWVLKDRKKKRPEPTIEKKIVKELDKPLPEIPVVDVVDNELIAVLTAAVAAFMDENPTGLRVKSYRRVSAENAWGRAGRSAQIYNKF